MQVDEKWQEFSQRVCYEGNVHIAVDALGGAPATMAQYNERGLHVLRALLSLDERRVENGDEDSPLIQELQRMDSKINVLLDIVDRLLLPATLLPAREPVRFNAIGMTLPESLVPAAEALCIRMHFDACRALPLELPARFGRPLADGSTFIYFCELSDLVEDGLERFVFCHHRRRVAEARMTGIVETVPAPKHRM
jgi:hypothetical protein